MLSRYLLMDRHGQLAGEAYADNPVAACRLADALAGRSIRRYAEHAPNGNEARGRAPGYFVYRADGADPVVTSPATPEMLAAVEALGAAAFVTRER